MNKVLFQEAENYIRGIFARDCSGHDAEHSIRVFRSAMRIAKKTEEADETLVGLSSLLHDVDDIKLFPENRNYENARCFLTEYQIESERQEQIIHIISQVSFKGTDSAIPDTIEGKIVQDADRLDAIGAIGIARAFAYGGSHHRPLYIPDETYHLTMNEAEYRSSVSSTIAHFHEKLLLLKAMMNTNEAKQIAEERHQFMLQFLTEFDEEVKGKR